MRNSPLIGVLHNPHKLVHAPGLARGNLDSSWLSEVGMNLLPGILSHFGFVGGYHS